MTAFRLVEYHRTGPRSYRPTFDTVDSAREAAERVLDALADRPARRPYRFDIVDLATGEPVARVPTTRPRDACIACGQPLDPFAQGGTESAGLDPPAPTPSVLP